MLSETQSIADSISRLDRFDLTNRQAVLPDLDECRRIVAHLDQMQPAGLAAGEKAGRAIVGPHPRTDVEDPEMYFTTIAAILSEYPQAVLDRIADPRTGIVRKVKFLPRPQEIAEFCDAELQRRRNLVAKARYIIKLHDERLAETEKKPTMTEAELESRREHVARILKLRNAPN